VGNDGETLVADSSTSTGLRWTSQFLAGKNKVINGDFKIWQRGSTFNSIATSTYAADRFQFGRDGNGTFNVTRETFTPGTAPVAGYEGQFYWKTTTATIGTSTYADCTQYIEDVRTFAGQTMTVSFWAKTNAARAVTVFAGADWNSASGVDYVNAGITTSTSWTRYSVTLNVTSATGKTIGANSSLSILIRCPMVASSTFEIWGVQAEAGSVATPFSTATGTIQGELAACQRYYYKHIATENVAVAFASGTAIAQTALNFPITMRIAPTITLPASGSSTGQIAFLNSSANYPATIGTLSASRITVSTFSVTTTTATGAYTAGNASVLFVTGTAQTAYEASAEL
jgi:hypothetical protein